MTGHRSRRSVLTAALGIGALPVLSACSADAASGGGKKAVRIAYQAFPSGDLIVKDRGWLEKALPDHHVTWTKFDSGASINTAFLAKSVDIAAIGSSPVARGLSAPLNIPYRVIWVLDVAGENEALVARKGTGISDVRDLTGHKVATPFSSTSHYSLLAALDRSGVDPSKVDILDMEPQDVLAAWTRGDIDAAYIWLPTLAELEKSGRVLVTSKELAKSGKPTLDLGVAAASFIQAHPEVISAWRKAQARALDLIHDDPSAATAAVARQLGISARDARAQLDKGIFLRPAEQASDTWLGRPGRVGHLAEDLRSATAFLADQKQINAVPGRSTLVNAIHVKGLADDVAR
ncbi:taurine ABC transporter substrate-binding protein [Streptomyces sp. NPDC000941]